MMGGSCLYQGPVDSRHSVEQGPLVGILILVSSRKYKLLAAIEIALCMLWGHITRSHYGGRVTRA